MIERLWFRLARSHPALPFVTWGPLAVLALGLAARRGAVGAALVWFMAGALAWTFAEYALHRWFLHVGSPGGPAALRHLNYRVHGLHHRFPADDHIAVFPVWVVAPISLAIFAACAALAPAPYHLALWSGVTISYLLSDFVHWSTHQREPLTFIGRAQRDRHLSHHFADDSRGYGIVTGFWDVLFGSRCAPLPPGASMAAMLARREGPFDFQHQLRAEGFAGLETSREAARLPPSPGGE